jgi:hypothetical protein
MLARNRQKTLPPVRSSNSTTRTNQTTVRRTPAKPTTLPPIENNKKNDSGLPTVFILSTFFNIKNKINFRLIRLGSSSSTTLCSRLMERYNQITYLHINDIANIDDDDDIGKIFLDRESMKINAENFRFKEP